MLLAGTVFLALSLQPKGEPSTWARVAHVVGVFGVVLVGNVLLGMAAAGVGRKHDWRAQFCASIGAPLTLAGLLGTAWGLHNGASPLWHPWSVALASVSWVSGAVCRKIIYPQQNWYDPAPAEPPLTLR